jgi:hypothetical protein
MYRIPRLYGAVVERPVGPTASTIAGDRIVTVDLIDDSTLIVEADLVMVARRGAGAG